MTELQHHGILGMKWGVRRYQNADGTLTAAGKRRYQKEIKKSRVVSEVSLDNNRTQQLQKATRDYNQKITACKNKVNLVRDMAISDKQFVAKVANDVADAYADAASRLPSEDPDYREAVNYWIKRNLMASSKYGPEIERVTMDIDSAVSTYRGASKKVTEHLVSSIKDTPIGGVTISDAIQQKILLDHEDVSLFLSRPNAGYYLSKIEPSGNLSASVVDQLVRGRSFVDSSGNIRPAAEYRPKGAHK